MEKEINQKGSGTERSILMGFLEVQALITPWPNVEIFLSFCFLKWHNAHYFTAVTTNTRPQRFFSPGSNLRFGGRQSTVTMVFHALAPVVQTLDSAIHRINHYPADKY